MQKIDSHQHFWLYDSVKHSWIADSMKVIRKDFLPADLQPILQQNNIDGCVAVQADETELETDFLIKLANENSFIKGVVGWVDLTAFNCKKRLAHYHQFKIVKGFRQILQSREPEFMLQPKFINGIAALKEFNFNYDLLIFPKHLPAAIKLVKQFPEQKFVIDHIAKPPIKDGLISNWKKDIQTIAQYDNVFCKISGMVTEANLTGWKPSHFTPYLNTVVASFGTKRIMFGSDWPVCLVAADYAKMKQITTAYFASFSATEQQDFFGGNAAEFYKL